MEKFRNTTVALSAAIILAVSASCQKDNGDNDFQIPDMDYISSRVWDSYFAKFFPEETLFYVMDGGNFMWNENKDGYKYITAKEFTEQYAMDWNYENPNNLIQAEDLMGFDFQESEGYTHYAEFNFRDDGILVCWDGITTPNGYTVSELNCKGEFSLDENTGILTVTDVANAFGTRTVLIQLTIQHYGELSFEILEKKYFGLDYVEGSLFPFMLSNYDSSQQYVPGGRIRYDCREADESRHTEKDEDGDIVGVETEMHRLSSMAPSDMQ